MATAKAKAKAKAKTKALLIIQTLVFRENERILLKIAAR
jgi:hypothetical protein